MPQKPHDEVFIDLHGEVPGEVVRRLQDELQRAFCSKIRHVTFVHGQGRHNANGVSEIAKKTREFLRALESTPEGAIQKVEFGEFRRDLGLNAGSVRVTLAIQLPRESVRYSPVAVPIRAGRGDRKKAVRVSDHAPKARLEKANAEAEAVLRRRYGKPGLEGPYRPADPNLGEWPGHK